MRRVRVDKQASPVSLLERDSLWDQAPVGALQRTSITPEDQRWARSAFCSHLHMQSQTGDNFLTTYHCRDHSAYFTDGETEALKTSGKQSLDLNPHLRF